MDSSKKKRLSPTAFAACALVTLLCFPAQAGKKKTGDINPTSVALVDSDFALKAAASLATITDPVTCAQIGAEAAHEVATGSGVLVAVLDTGFTLYSDAFDRQMSVLGYDFVDGDDDPYDCCSIDAKYGGRAWGHGTMVAAMVLNAAPSATILPLRVRDPEGHGTDGPIVDAIYYAMKVGADVINLSISVDTTDDTNIQRAVIDARDYGVVVVASAGNEGLPYIPFTATAKASLIVGAVDREDVIAPFSNYAKWTTYNGSRMVYAPGVNVLGPYLVDGAATRCAWSGTSFAAGLVSGAVALVLESHPDWTPEDVAKQVSLAVDRVRLPKGGPKFASGRVNLQELVSK